MSARLAHSLCCTSPQATPLRPSWPLPASGAKRCKAVQRLQGDAVCHSANNGWRETGSVTTECDRERWQGCQLSKLCTNSLHGKRKTYPLAGAQQGHRWWPLETHPARINSCLHRPLGLRGPLKQAPPPMRRRHSILKLAWPRPVLPGIVRRRHRKQPPLQAAGAAMRPPQSGRRHVISSSDGSQHARPAPLSGCRVGAWAARCLQVTAGGRRVWGAHDDSVRKTTRPVHTSCPAPHRRPPRRAPPAPRGSCWTQCPPASVCGGGCMGV